MITKKQDRSIEIDIESNELSCHLDLTGDDRKCYVTPYLIANMENIMDLITAWNKWAKRMKGAGWREWNSDGAVWLHCDEWIGLRSVTSWQMFLRDEVPNPYQLATVDELTKLPRECVLHVV